ncbi:MAG: DUF1844 domain-containing protein [Deltaproteobacteria bacterium]|nr:MAG: DUF1844 domain-containing protein [Deltaproteobacteria bacterium]
MTESSTPSDADHAASGDLPVTFAHFVVSLGSSALVHLGEVADPSTGKVEKNLPLARNTIDVLSVLKEKTAGNLDDDETRLLDALLFDLRQKYIAASAS